jgi:NAD(P)-dependent dehydrogenase (short-subunit alcohol dehydrogenase family)
MDFALSSSPSFPVYRGSREPDVVAGNVAAAVAFLVSDDAAFITGTTLNVAA